LCANSCKTKIEVKIRAEPTNISSGSSTKKKIQVNPTPITSNALMVKCLSSVELNPNLAEGGGV